MEFVIAYNELSLYSEKFVLFLVLLASISIHEWAHAVTADRLGDPLPRSQGRVTLDPRSHIDLIGTIVLPMVMIFASPGFAVFGWGKPVQVSLPNLKSRKRDDILITLAGPVSNLAIALITVLLFSIFGLFFQITKSLFSVLFIAVNLNCLLFLFNLIPIPPLDGSHLLKNAINMKAVTFNKLSKYGFFILLILINLPIFNQLMSECLLVLRSFFLSIFSQIAY
jgi:Zn-dependent protease